MPVDALPDDIDLVCVTPSHQAPTGATLPMARRRALLEAAEARDFLIIEDDYDFEMSFLKPTNPALKAEDGSGRVLHIGSYSKSLYPGLRLGYLVAPRALHRRARGLRTLMVRHAPGATQRTTAHFLAMGHYNAHVRRLRGAFRDRRAVMARALEEVGLTTLGASEFGGAGFWVTGPADLDARVLAQELRGDGVLIEPGDVFYADPDGPRNRFRMAYSSIPASRITEGVACVAARIRALRAGAT